MMRDGPRRPRNEVSCPHRLNEIMPQTPTMGRIVHVVLACNGRMMKCPAIVLREDFRRDGIRAFAFVFGDDDNYWPIVPNDGFFTEDQAAERVNTWHWPPRAASTGEVKVSLGLDLSQARADIDTEIVRVEVAKKMLADAQPTSNMSFGQALEALEDGKKVARAGWNGKGMWLKIIPAGNAIFRDGGNGYDMQDCIGMKTASPRGEMQPGWLASQPDMLAKDWMVVT